MLVMYAGAVAVPLILGSAMKLNLYFNGLGSRAEAARDASTAARQAEA